MGWMVGVWGCVIGRGGGGRTRRRMVMGEMVTVTLIIVVVQKFKIRYLILLNKR